MSGEARNCEQLLETRDGLWSWRFKCVRSFCGGKAGLETSIGDVPHVASYRCGSCLLGQWICWVHAHCKKMRQISISERPHRSRREAVKTLYILWDLILRHPELEDVYQSLLLRSNKGSMSTDCEREKKKYHIGLVRKDIHGGVTPPDQSSSSRPTSQQDAIAEKFLRSNNEAQ